MAAARQRSNCTLAHPVFADKLFHDLRNCASLQSGTARYIRPRKRLVGANQLQHNVSVDPARSFAGSQLNVG
jgi:hypothetical protein